MAAQIRAASMRLRKDLEGITVPVRPWAQRTSGEGFFEYYDGPGNDSDSDGDGTKNGSDITDNNDTSRGDLDDYVMFTCRSVNEEFRGRYLGSTAQASVAEIAWWVAPADTNQNGTLGELGELYNIYRRTLLVRPDLNGAIGYVQFLPYPSFGPVYNVTNSAHLAQMTTDITAFLNDNDISVHFVRVASGNNVNILIVANSLGDLTLRQNRFGHDVLVSAGSYVPSPTAPYDLASSFNNVSFAALALTGVNQGEDVMLSRVLAFDIRAFDPEAVLWATTGEDKDWGVDGVDDDGVGGTDDTGEAGWTGSDDEAVGPGDLGYCMGVISLTSGGGTVPPVAIGKGCFVDLSYANKFRGNAVVVPASIFSANGGAFVPATKATISLPVYDTWAYDYERDGVDQNQNMELNAANLRFPDGIDNDSDGLIDEFLDEGTDGLDNDTNNGVDDVNERETSPPYPVPLRAIRAVFRMLDPDTRQVRETSVVADFVPE